MSRVSSLIESAAVFSEIRGSLKYGKPNHFSNKKNRLKKNLVIECNFFFLAGFCINYLYNVFEERTPFEQSAA